MVFEKYRLLSSFVCDPQNADISFGNETAKLCQQWMTSIYIGFVHLLKKNYILGFHLASIDDDVNVGWVGEVGGWSSGVGAWDDKKIGTLDGGTLLCYISLSSG